MESLQAFQRTSDNGFILGGTSSSGVNGDKTQPAWGGFLDYDYWVIKIDSAGIKQWDKRFGTTSPDVLTCLVQTTDGGYLLGGYTSGGVSGDKTQPLWGQEDYWIVKIDALGAKQWDRRFGGAHLDQLTSLQQTIDGGYILAGLSDSGISGDKTQSAWLLSTDYWIVKIDSTGTKQWDKRYGGTEYEILYSIIQTEDKGYLLGGKTQSGMSGDKTQANWDQDGDYWVVKIDSTGNKQWDRRFGGIREEDLRSLIQTKDHGYVLTGLSHSGVSGDKTAPMQDTTLNHFVQSDFWLVKIDENGTKQWDKKFGGWDAEDEFYNVSPTSDGGFLIAGVSYSQASGDKSEPNLGLEQGWVIKVDSLWNKQWDKTIFTTAHDEICIAYETSEGCYAMAGATYVGIGGYKSEPNWDTTTYTLPALFTYDYWMLKLCDAAHAGCNLASPVIASNQTIFCANDSALICAPTIYTNYLWNNGAQDQCITTNLAGNYYVTVTDVNGCTAESNRIAITVLRLPPISISVNSDTLTVNNSTIQQWYLNGSAINGATANTYIATQGGSYTVMVTDSNGCTAISSPVIISGIENISEEDIVSVYPNPLTVGGWQLTVGNSFIGGKAEVFDANGRVVFQSEIRNPQSEISAELSGGVYLLKVSSANRTVTRKLIRLQ